jgi:hypothetical protein
VTSVGRISPVKTSKGKIFLNFCRSKVKFNLRFLESKRADSRIKWGRGGRVRRETKGTVYLLAQTHFLFLYHSPHTSLYTSTICSINLCLQADLPCMKPKNNSGHLVMLEKYGKKDPEVKSRYTSV